MTTRTNEGKILVIINAIMTEENLTQTKKEIIMIVDMSVKSINCAKKITFGILTNVLYL